MKKLLRVFLIVSGLLTFAVVPASAAGHKTVICHKGKTITVATKSVASHLLHGDYLGACSG
jgi:hypothetical protein